MYKNKQILNTIIVVNAGETFKHYMISEYEIRCKGYPSLEDIYDLASDELKMLLTRMEKDSTIDHSEYMEYVKTELYERQSLYFFTKMVYDPRHNSNFQQLTDFNQQFLKLANAALQNKGIYYEQIGSAGNYTMQREGKHYESMALEQIRYDGVGYNASIVSEESKVSANMYYTKKMGFGKRKPQPKPKAMVKGEKVVIQTNNPHNRLGALTDEHGHLLRNRLPNPQNTAPHSHKNIKYYAVTKQYSDKYINKFIAQPHCTQNIIPHHPLKRNIVSQESKSTQYESITSQQNINSCRQIYNNKKETLNCQKNASAKKGGSVKKIEKKNKKTDLNAFLVEMVREYYKKKKYNYIKAEAKINASLLASMQVYIKSYNIYQIIINHQNLYYKPVQNYTISCQIINNKIKYNENAISYKNIFSSKYFAYKVKDRSNYYINKDKKENIQGQSYEKEYKIYYLIDEVIEYKKYSLQYYIVEYIYYRTYTLKQTAVKDKIKYEYVNEYEYKIKYLQQMRQYAIYSIYKTKKQYQIIDEITILSNRKEYIIEEELIKKIIYIPKHAYCYNYYYWNHLRDYAYAKIERFRLYKYILLKRTYSYSEKVYEEYKALSQIIEEVKLMHKYYKSKKTEYKKEYKKKAMMVLTRSIHPLPQFNYLYIYPSFEDIFSLRHWKGEQGMSEFANVVRDIRSMMVAHVSHFRTKKVFQPATFLPFDRTTSTVDPHELLLNAENTYVDLRTMVHRLEVFGANLYGRMQEGDPRHYRVVKTKEEVYDIVTTSFLRRNGWKELPHGCSLHATWNLFWSWSKPYIDFSRLLVWQRVNHFPFNKNISRKDLLYRNLDTFRRQSKISMNFLPLTFALPKYFTMFSSKFHEEEVRKAGANYWIMKPIGKSRGRGIKVVSSLAYLSYTDNIIVQQYIANPLLLEGYKFDMRIYVLLTNLHPLEAFLYREGFARLSTYKYSLDPDSISNAFVHLTNFAINRKNSEAKTNSLFEAGSKISLKILKYKLTKMGYSFAKVWHQVTEIVVKSLVACSATMPAFPNAFYLFGYDIMIDSYGQCHLIEVNASPSLYRSYVLDDIIKQSLIDDIFDILDPPSFDKEAFLDVMAERTAVKKKFSTQYDLIAIARCLKYQPLRKIGQIPAKSGLFEMIAPSPLSIYVEKSIKAKSGANNPHNID